MFLSVIVSSIAGKFAGWFAKEIPTLSADGLAEIKVVETALVAFAKTDLGKLAIDGVNYAGATVTAGGDTARAAAKVKFIADAKLAGHDLSAIGDGIVDWMIQTAYTVVAGVVAQSA